MIPLLGSWKDYEDIDFSLLPKQFVLKCNHDSGSVVICRNKEKFEGTFIDYLELVKANPDIAQLSHKRLYERIMSEGVEVLKGDENHGCYFTGDIAVRDADGIAIAGVAIC